MAAFPITAWAAINAAGDDADAVVTAIARGRDATDLHRDGLRPLPSAHTDHDRHVTRLARAGLGQLDEALDRARQRWGSSRLAAIVAMPPDDDDALVVAARLQAPPPEPTAAGLAALLEHIVSGPAYAMLQAGPAGADAVAGAVSLIEADIADAVLAGGIATADPETGHADACAFVLIERHASALIDLRDASATVPDDVAYVHSLHDATADVVCTTRYTGTLGAAAGVTELVIAAQCLRRDVFPGPGASSLTADHVVVDVGARRWLVSARVS
jgi:3-oxoacyl-(acyl-carrier-protein) synthase